LFNIPGEISLEHAGEIMIPLISFAPSTKSPCKKRFNEHSIIGKPSYYEENKIASQNHSRNRK